MGVVELVVVPVCQASTTRPCCCGTWCVVESLTLTHAAHVHLSPNNGVPEPPEPVCAFLRGVTPPCVKSRLRTNFTRKSMKNNAKWDGLGVDLLPNYCLGTPRPKMHKGGGVLLHTREGRSLQNAQRFYTFWGPPSCALLKVGGSFDHVRRVDLSYLRFCWHVLSAFGHVRGVLERLKCCGSV